MLNIIKGSTKSSNCRITTTSRYYKYPHPERVTDFSFRSLRWQLLWSSYLVSQTLRWEKIMTECILCTAKLEVPPPPTLRARVRALLQFQHQEISPWVTAPYIIRSDRPGGHPGILGDGPPQAEHFGVLSTKNAILKGKTGFKVKKIALAARSKPTYDVIRFG